MQNDSANVVILAPPLINVLGNDYDSEAPPLTINSTTLRGEVCDDDGACATRI